ncbi:hypothetical protein tb265_26250 [Gemmatimonadetes bacterium T265]|nr:hypothetical protein tb265_26250 [Gemmatimonadetes bacterium T265]
MPVHDHPPSSAAEVVDVVAPDRGLAPVSVVIPTYRRAEYLQAALDSVFGQTRPPREVIVVDDGSPDDTAARLAPLAQAGRIRYVRQANAGMSAARNAGAALATSKYLLFLDDDDLLVPTALAWLVDEIERDPAVGFVYGDAVLFSGAVPPIEDAPDAVAAPADLAVFLVFNRIGSPGQALVRRAAFEAVGRWRNQFTNVEDWDLWLKLLARYPARGAQRPVLAYRLHEHNISRNMVGKYVSSLSIARLHLAALPPDRRPIVQALSHSRLRRYHAPHLAEMFGAALRDRQWTRARRAGLTWVRAWMVEGTALVAMKAHLVRQGRWRLHPDDPARALYLTQY